MNQDQWAEALQRADAWKVRAAKAERVISDDVHVFEWMHRHRANQGESITTLGRRWLTRAIWHLENRVETELRKQR